MCAALIKLRRSAAGKICKINPSELLRSKVRRIIEHCAPRKTELQSNSTENLVPGLRRRCRRAVRARRHFARHQACPRRESLARGRNRRSRGFWTLQKPVKHQCVTAKNPRKGERPNRKLEILQSRFQSKIAIVNSFYKALVFPFVTSKHSPQWGSTRNRSAKF